MDQLHLLRLRLQDLERGGISELSRISGIAHTTIMKIRDGKSANPGVLTVENLSKALDKLEAEQSAPAEPSQS